MWMKTNSTHVIAYIDMLGTTSKIKASSSGNALLQIKQIYEQMIGIYSTGAMADEHIKTKVFSDNIIIARETSTVDQTVSVNLGQMIGLAAAFQFRAMISGWPVRGGITVGNLYMDDIFVWGTGLLRAYELESKIAITPRIVIDPNLESEILDKYTVHCWRKDAGLSIVNYLSMCGNEETMKAVRNPIIDLLKSSNEMTIGKIEWLKDDFNKMCREKQYYNLIIPD